MGVYCKKVIKSFATLVWYVVLCRQANLSTDMEKVLHIRGKAFPQL